MPYAPRHQLSSHFLGHRLGLRTHLFDGRVAAVAQQIERDRRSQRGLSDAMRAEEARTADAVIAALYECSASLPVTSLAIPLYPGAYKIDDPARIALGYKNVAKVLAALTALGWIEIVERGWHNAAGQGKVTRFAAAGDLKQFFTETGARWMPQEAQPGQELIILKDTVVDEHDPDILTKHVVPTPDTPATREFRANLTKLNAFLFEHCICLDVTDDQLLTLSHELMTNHPMKVGGQRRTPAAINFLRVGLRRIFARGSFEKHGRFYGGWWQSVPSKYRPFITIDDRKTVELDYSGMALRLLYAIEGRDIGEDDPYAIGIPDEGNPGKRALIKEFTNAILNDENGRFRLKTTELDFLGVAHHELLRLIERRHHHVAHHFNTGVGLKLMYQDSVIAEKVMHNLMSLDIVCLPIHDSFIVRTGFEQALELAMNVAFKEVTGKDTKIKATYRPLDPEVEALSRQRHNALSDAREQSLTADGVPEGAHVGVVHGRDLWDRLDRDDRKIYRGFVGSWLQQHPLSD